MNFKFIVGITFSKLIFDEIILLAPRSKRFILPPIIIGVSALFGNIWTIMLGIGFIGIGLFFAIFFRDPLRFPTVDQNTILAAADGTILYIEESEESLKIATRMSPFNVHINRAPISGKMVLHEHSPGEHKNVYFGGAEEKNERMLSVYENEEFKCEVLQLTGAFARRIELWLEPGQEVEMGDKIGIIRFGSQTNVLISSKLKKKNISSSVKVGDRVFAGLTVIAEVRE